MTHSIGTSTSHPTNPAPTLAQQVAGAACSAVVMAGAGAAAGAMFTPVGAAGGAIFGASFSLSNSLISMICTQLNCCPDSTIANIAKCALGILGGIAAGVAITTALGFQITMATGAILVVASVGVLAGTVLLGGVCCCGAIAGALALGNNANIIKA